MIRPNCRTGERSFGRTLVELVIAIAIGAAILAGVATMFLSGRGMSRLAQQVGSAEHAARLALNAIGDGIKVAGYGEIVGSDPAAEGQTMFDGAALRGCTGSRFVDAFNTLAPDYSCAGDLPGDQLLVRFQGSYTLVRMDAAQLAGSALPDCLGASNPAQDMPVSAATPRAAAGVVRRVAQSAFALDNSGDVLRCHGNGNPRAPAPIANDVVEFRLFYRFDDAGHELATGHQTNYAPLGGTVRDAAWINATSRASPVDPWRHVVAVIVCITVATREAGTAMATRVGYSTRCPRDAAEASAGGQLLEAAVDGRLRRTFTETFTVRSQATAAPSIAL